MAVAAVTMAIDNGTVLMMVPLIVLPIAAIAFARSGAAWREIGKGPFAMERVEERGTQEADARQMIEAKSYLRGLRGEAPLDVEAELDRLFDQDQPSGADEELRAEVRRLVIARNERRLRQGEAALDVEAETERQLADFVGSG